MEALLKEWEDEKAKINEEREAALKKERQKAKVVRTFISSLSVATTKGLAS
jgi:hypothetical protein